MYAALSAATDRDGSHVCSIARLLFVLGQTCLSSLVYTEAIAATAKKYPTDKDQRRTRGGVAKTALTSEDGVGFMENVEAVDAMEEEMGAAAADDADQEKVCIYRPHLL